MSCISGRPAGTRKTSITQQDQTMLRGILTFVVVAAFAVAASSASFASSAVAAPSPAVSAAASSAGTTVVPVDVLLAPDKAAELVSNRQHAAYDAVLAAYRDALRTHPGDATLAVAECHYIQRFAWSEDLGWSDAASKDLENCMTMLGKQFADDPEVRLMQLDAHYGKEAIAYGEPLLAQSAGWTAAQRARLHAALSRAHSTQRDPQHAGEQALLATRLDPSSVLLSEALRYLAREQRVPEAVALLAAAPLPKFQWQETQRINTAVDVLPPSAARDELRRAQHAGLEIDAYTVARALQHAGDAAGAQAALAKVPSPEGEIVQRRRFRLDVAFENRDAATAAKVLGDWAKQMGSTTPLALSYAHLIFLSPAKAFAPNLAPLAGSLILFMLAFVMLPSVLLFPAHYRGTVRVRLGKPLEPLFDRIGLRHAWYAFSIYFAALYLVPSFRSGSPSPAYGDVLTSADAQRQIAISMLWVFVFAALGFGWIAKRVTWREWFGGGRWKVWWFLVPLACVGFAAFEYWKYQHGTHLVQLDWVSTWVSALVSGARSIGGLPFALLIVSGLVPLFEEFVFRLCLLGGLSRHLSFGWANVCQAAVFATMHHDSTRIPFYIVFGLTAGWLAKKTKGLAVPIVFHAANNAVFVLMMTH
jgi:uncharacterized protein